MWYCYNTRSLSSSLLGICNETTRVVWTFPRGCNTFIWFRYNIFSPDDARHIFEASVSLQALSQCAGLLNVRSKWDANTGVWSSDWLLLDWQPYCRRAESSFFTEVQAKFVVMQRSLISVVWLILQTYGYYLQQYNTDVSKVLYKDAQRNHLENMCTALQ